MSSENLEAGSVLIDDVRKDLAQVGLPEETTFLVRASHEATLNLAHLAIDFKSEISEPAATEGGAIAREFKVGRPKRGKYISWSVVADRPVPQIAAYLVKGDSIRVLASKEELLALEVWSGRRTLTDHLLGGDEHAFGELDDPDLLEEWTALKGGAESWNQYRRDNDMPVIAGFDLSGLDLSDADFMHVDFGVNVRTTGTNFSGACFKYANLGGANFAGANLRGADLEAADLSHASFVGANLAGADLDHANLKRANLREADLSGASVREAFLQDTDLTNADLSGVDLRQCADLSFNFYKAKGDEDTVPPEGEDRPAHWLRS